MHQMNKSIDNVIKHTIQTIGYHIRQHQPELTYPNNGDMLKCRASLDKLEQIINHDFTSL